MPNASTRGLLLTLAFWVLGLALHFLLATKRLLRKVYCLGAIPHDFHHSLKVNTPYSMNRLFSEFFRKFGGVFLEVCETISRGIWQVLRGKIKENYIEKNKKR